MKTEFIQSQAIQLFSSGAKSSESAGKDSFESVMNQSLQSSDNSSKTTDKSQKESNKTEVATYNSQNDKLNVAAKTKSKDIDSSEAASIQEELVQGVAKIKEQLEDMLGLSEDEINSILDTLNLTMVDLLNVNNLTQFFLATNGENDMSVLLTNENFANQLQELTGTLEEIKMSLSQDVTMEDAKEIFAAIEQNNNILPEKASKVANKVNQTMDYETPVENSSGQVSTKVEVVHNEAASQNDTSSEQQESSDDYLNQFVQNLSSGNVNGETPLDQTQILAKTQQFREIVDQIVNQIKVTIQPDETNMELTLSPEHLGNVNLSITSKGGVLTAQILTETQVAKEAIESQIYVLKDTLTEQGLKIEAIEVAITNYSLQKDSDNNTSEKEQQNKSKSSKRSIQLEDAILEESMQESQSTVYDTIDGVGGQIDINA